MYQAHSCISSICYHTNLAYIMENGIYSIVGSIFVDPLMGAGPRVAIVVDVDSVPVTHEHKPPAEAERRIAEPDGPRIYTATRRRFQKVLACS